MSIPEEIEFAANSNEDDDFCYWLEHDWNEPESGLLEKLNQYAVSMPDCDDHCHNCCRFQPESGSGVPRLEMCLILTKFIKPSQNRLRQVPSTKTAEFNCLVLCRQCFIFLAKPSSMLSTGLLKRFEKASKKNENTWPSFCWNMLSGQDPSSKIYYHESYAPSHLWRFIPTRLRPYWMKAIHNSGVDLSNSITNNWLPKDVLLNAYENCSLEHPSPFFIDITEKYERHFTNINEYSVTGFLRALDPSRLPGSDPEEYCKKVVNSDILPCVRCPWGCAEYFFKSSFYDFTLLVQRQLSKVQLNLSSESSKKMHLVETSRMDYIRREGEPEDCILLNKEWLVLPSVAVISGEGLVALACRNHATRSSQQRLHCHPPRKPWHNLSAPSPDSLCPIVMKPRIYHSACTKTYNSISTTSVMHANFAGVDVADVCTNDTYNGQSEMKLFHETLSIWSRPDIRQLAHQKVVEGRIHQTLFDDWMEMCQQTYKPEHLMAQLGVDSLDGYKRGSTYCPTYNALILQRHANEDNTVPVIVKQRTVAGAAPEDKMLLLERSWDALNYNCQEEDYDNYGCPIKAIQPYKTTSNGPHMTMYALVAMISSCNALHYMIDQKSCSHSYKNWTGHILSHISYVYMKHSDNNVIKKSPFVGSRSVSKLLKMLETDLSNHPTMDENSHVGDIDAELHFMFGVNYIRSLFPSDQFPKLAIASSLIELLSSETQLTSKEVIIIVGPDCPKGNAEIVSRGMNPIKFEARFLMSLDGKVPNNESLDDESCKSWKFEAKRYVRHGGKFCNWYVQDRTNKSASSHVMTKYKSNGDINDFPPLQQDCFRYVTVYVNTTVKPVEDYKLELHRSLGGQCKAFCTCSNSPLIISGTRRSTRRKCMIMFCQEWEKYTCSQSFCQTKLCKGCFEYISKQPGKQYVKHTYLPSRYNRCNAKQGADEYKEEEEEEEEEGDSEEEEFNLDDESAENSISDCLDYDEYSYESLPQEVEHQANNNTTGDNDTTDDELEEFFEEDDANSKTSSVYVANNEVQADMFNDSEIDDEESFYSEGEPATEDCLDDGMPVRDRLWRENKRRKLSSNSNRGNVRQSKRLKQKKDADIHYPNVAVEETLRNYVTGTNGYPFNVDMAEDGNSVPSTNASDFQVHLFERLRNGRSDSYTMDRDEDSREESVRVPMHVIFNQTGALCTRYRKRITGLQMQQHVVQKFVSSVAGHSVPVLYLLGSLFPKHFWSCATDDKASILGVLPISCYRKKQHPHGFASMQQTAQNYITHASSSTSTCHNIVATLYSIMCNQAMNEFNSKQVTRQGFKVCTNSKSGLSIGNNDESNLRESLDSRQGALNLASAVHNGAHFDLFVTWTLHQAQFPGVRHLNQWKNSRLWTKEIPGYEFLSVHAKAEITKSFEMAYISVMNRNWLEVRKLLIDLLLTSSTTILKKVVHAFFRDEYQELSGNVSHLHGLMGLKKDDMENEEFKRFVCDLQRNSVCDLIPTDEIQGMIDDGLLRDEDDWRDVIATAAEILPHNCDKRCKLRVDKTGDDNVDLKCKKKHPVFDSIDPLSDDFIPVSINPSEACLDALQQCKLYEPPSNEWPNGRFLHPMLKPKRHMGKVTPSARENMSPVNPRFFALTRSMQNLQVITETNGVSRYVVKYVIKMDRGNRCSIWADAHTGSVLRADYQFLHNTKISRSAKNEDEAHAKSRRKGKPSGRFIGACEMIHQILSHADAFCTEVFVEICSRAMEFRPTTKVSLDSKTGKLRRPDNYQIRNSEGDVVTPGLDPCRVRDIVLRGRRERQLTEHQRLLIRPQTTKSAKYCMVTLFSLRPVELLQLFRRIQMYFSWFIIDKKPLSVDEMEFGLKENVVKSMWIDGIGRRVRLRRQTLMLVHNHLISLNEDGMHDYSKALRKHLLTMIERNEEDELFVANDDGQKIPIPVFSNITPDRGVPFLQHMLISLGEYETELDFKHARNLRECFVRAKLMPDGDMENEEFLAECAQELLRKAVTECLKVLPISTTRLWGLIVMCRRLFEKVIIENEIPMEDYPPCLLTDLLNQHDKKMKDEWTNRRNLQLTAMLKDLPPELLENLPSREAFFNATKDKRVNWDPREVFVRFHDQSEESHREQQYSLNFGIRAVQNYLVCTGPMKRTKGVLTHGVPGAGKSFVLMAQGLYAMSQGLRVMSTSLMAERANQLGGIHIHRLFALDIKQIKNLHQDAEMAVDKLQRKTFTKFLHILLTMDVLLLDECGQLSAEQFALLDIVLREVRENNLPFGGVLIFGTFDHAQIGAIRGMPFLMSSFILTDFTLVKLTHSVRAHADQELQEIQNITRMNPDRLKADDGRIKARFFELVRRNFKFLPSWEDPALPANCQRMYSKRRPASQAANASATAMLRSLKERNIECIESLASDFQQVDGSRAPFKEATNSQLLAEIDRKVDEPKQLIFFRGGFYESTINGEGYNQSSLLLMLNIPLKEDIASRNPISLYAPPNTRSNEASRQMINSNQLPTANHLENEGWTKVTINIAPEKLVRRSNLVGIRKQYTLRHIGNSTINKQMGNTLTVPCAIEMSEDCSPWDKEQIVVMVSRSPTADLIHIIGDEEYAVNKMWEVICKKNQWSDLTESILRNLSVSADTEDLFENTDYRIVDMARHYPYNLSSLVLPDESCSSCVYLLVSLTNMSRMYVGETINIGGRLKTHNTSSGTIGTAPAIFKPYGLAAYICGPALEKGDRVSLEQRWQHMNQRSVLEGGVSDVDTMVENGRRILREYNLEHTEEKHLTMMVFAKSN